MIMEKEDGQDEADTDIEMDVMYKLQSLNLEVIKEFVQPQEIEDKNAEKVNKSDDRESTEVSGDAEAAKEDKDEPEAAPQPEQQGSDTNIAADDAVTDGEDKTKDEGVSVARLQTKLLHRRQRRRGGGKRERGDVFVIVCSAKLGGRSDEWLKRREALQSMSRLRAVMAR